MKKNLRNLPTRTTAENFSEAAFELAQIEPNSLRDRVYAALTKLPSDERAEMRDQIIGRLKDLGVNFGTGLFLLGIPARTMEDLTPADVAKLLRYLQINAPQAMAAISTQLASLLAMAPIVAPPALPWRRAA